MPVPDAVKDAVLAWANAEDLDVSANVLTRARRELAADLHPILTSEVAAVTAKSFVALLSMEATSVGKPIEILGIEFPKRQAERIGAWVGDQASTAEALGVDAETWSQKVALALSAYREQLKAGGKDLGRVTRAQKLLGTNSTSGQFQPRAGGGLASLIAAKKFDDK